jgi:ATP-dependent Clp protease ATP-binding subunit ClpA
MRRLLQETLEDSIAGGMLDESYQKGDVVNVSAKKSTKNKEPQLTYSAITE